MALLRTNVRSEASDGISMTVKEPNELSVAQDGIDRAPTSILRWQLARLRWGVAGVPPPARLKSNALSHSEYQVKGLANLVQCE